MKALLTSAGFDNDNLVGVFHELLVKPPESAKAILVPTALNTPEAKKYVHVFMDDLFKVGITEKNIEIFDLDEPYDIEKINEIDVVLVCPGDPVFLLDKINEVNFKKALESFQANGGVYVGISAGSDVAAANLAGGLGYLDSKIECHSEKGSTSGLLNAGKNITIKLTDNQAIVIKDNEKRIVE